MKDLAREFFQGSLSDPRPFFLYIGFFDPHRCDPYGKYGKYAKKKKNVKEKKRRIEKRCVHNKSLVLTGTVLFLPVHRNNYKGR